MALPKLDRRHPLAAAVEQRIQGLDPTERHYLLLRLALNRPLEALGVLNDIQTLGTQLRNQLDG